MLPTDFLLKSGVILNLNKAMPIKSRYQLGMWYLQPSIQEAKTGRSRVQGQPELQTTTTKLDLKDVSKKPGAGGPHL
jgi:hypothetical protein